LPMSFQKASIDYKYWKTYSNQQPSIRIDIIKVISHLRKQLCCANAKFQKYYNRYYEQYCFPFQKVLDKQDIYQFALLNSKCLYKICKRIDKRIHLTVCMNWFTAMRCSQIYGILGGCLLKHLELDVKHTYEQCPICLDEKPKQTAILSCGHTMCCECMRTITHSEGRNGQLHNLVADYIQTGHELDCPICRSKVAFRKILILTHT
jgi:hypothetical protein